MAASLTTEPVQSLAVLRSMLTYPEAARAASEELAAYRARLAATIPGPGAELRAAMVTATVLGVIVSRHMLKLEELAEATPEQVIELLRPCLRLLTRADEAGAAEAEADEGTRAPRSNEPGGSPAAAPRGGRHTRRRLGTILACGTTVARRWVCDTQAASLPCPGFRRKP